jgi:hypothetical protein
VWYSSSNAPTTVAPAGCPLLNLQHGIGIGIGIDMDMDMDMDIMFIMTIISVMGIRI